jgi:hypothetical protein
VFKLKTIQTDVELHSPMKRKS